MWGDGSERRAYIFISDIDQWDVNRHGKNGTPDPINLGSDEEITIGELSMLILKLSNFEYAKIVYDKSKPKGQSRISANTQKAMKLTGFVPQTKLKEGLKNTIEWYE